MYKLLLVLDQGQEQFASIFAQADAFRPVRCVTDAAQAVALLEKEHYDAVGTLPDSAAEEELTRYLEAKDSAIPLFEITDSPTLAREMRHLLNRLHNDYFEGTLSQQEMVRIVINDLIHNLINGSLKVPGLVPRWFRILRAPLDASLPCRIWEMTIPQRQQYVGGRWHYGEYRLEDTLARTFFNRCDTEHEYHMAFTGDTGARLIAIPTSPDSGFSRTDRAVDTAIEDIKEYLDLDIIVQSAETVPCLTAAALADDAG